MAGFVPEGIMTALVTPFHPDGSLNPEVVAELVDFQVKSGVSALVTTAGAGEYVMLSHEERIQMVKQTARALDGRAILVAGILAPDTGSAIKTAVAAKDAGAQALLVLTPYYISPSTSGLIFHFQQVAEQTRLPLLIYNNPGRTGINLDQTILEELARIPQVVGIKECDRDLGRVALKIKQLDSRLAFFGGDDDLMLPILSIGAAGAICSGTNLAAPWAVACFNAVKPDDWSVAREIFYSRLLPFAELYRGPDHPGPLKELLGVAGFRVGRGRPPLQPVSERRLAEMKQVLDELGLLRQALIE